MLLQLHVIVTPSNGSFVVNVIMNYVIDKVVITFLDHQLKLFCRCVDGCFAAFSQLSGISLSSHLKKLNMELKLAPMGNI